MPEETRQHLKEEKQMLAKELKIKNLKKQQDFIEAMLRYVAEGVDGDISMLYVGYVFPENVSHFQAEGYDVVRVKSDSLTAAAAGRPVYLFTPQDIELTEEERKQAEEYKCGVKILVEQGEIPSFLSKLFGSVPTEEDLF